MTFGLKSGRQRGGEELKNPICSLGVLYTFKAFELLWHVFFLFKSNYSQDSETCFYKTTGRNKLVKIKTHSQVGIIPDKLVKEQAIINNQL